MEHQKVKTATEAIEFPQSAVEYWLKHPHKNDGFHSMPCDYCDDIIPPGDEYFQIKYDHSYPVQNGHLSHLKVAPHREWVSDPKKHVLQPWETDPNIPTPEGWVEWQRKHEWARKPEG